MDRTPPTSCTITCSTAAGRRSSVRAILAATLGANWGVYGPAFELLEHTPREPGSEEYLNSEKYELKDWKLEPRQIAFASC